MLNMIHNILAISMPGGMEWVIILIIAVLIFGNRLPEVARNFGKTVAKFKEGIREASQLKDDIKSDIVTHVDDIKDNISSQVSDITKDVDDIQNDINKTT